VEILRVFGKVTLRGTSMTIDEAVDAMLDHSDLITYASATKSASSFAKGGVRGHTVTIYLTAEGMEPICVLGYKESLAAAICEAKQRFDQWVSEVVHAPAERHSLD
jgi:hypothetical protein